MRRVALGFAVVCALSAIKPAVACDANSVLFQDNFATVNPGWVPDPWSKNSVSIGGGALKIAPQLPPSASPGYNYSVFVPYRGDVYERADACADLTLSGGSGMPDGHAGMIFDDEDYGGFYYFWVSPKNGNAGVSRWSEPAEKWVEGMAATKVQGLGAKTALRVTVNGTHADVYVNGEQIGQLTVRATKIGGFFGLAASRTYGDASTWTFTNFKITDVPH